MRFSVLHCHKLAMQSWRHSTAFPFPREQVAAGPDLQRNFLKKEAQCEKSGPDNKGSYSIPTCK